MLSKRVGFAALLAAPVKRSRRRGTGARVGQCFEVLCHQRWRLCQEVWDAKCVFRLCISKLKPDQIVKDSVVTAAIDIAAALYSGEAVLWTGFLSFFGEYV